MTSVEYKKYGIYNKGYNCKILDYKIKDILYKNQNNINRYNMERK